MKKEFYIIVPFDQEADASVRKTDMFGIFSSFWNALRQEESVADIRMNRIRTDRLKKWNFERASTVKMSLESIGLKADVLWKEELIKLVYNYYNPRLKTENNLKSETENLNLW